MWVRGLSVRVFRIQGAFSAVGYFQRGPRTTFLRKSFAKNTEELLKKKSGINRLTGVIVANVFDGTHLPKLMCCVWYIFPAQKRARRTMLAIVRILPSRIKQRKPADKRFIAVRLLVTPQSWTLS